MAQTAQKFPDRRALMVNNPADSPRIIKYSELLDSFIKLSSVIQSKGFAPGDHIALLGPNCPEWAIAYLAIQAAGCIVVPLDANLRPVEHRHIIHHSDAKAIFLSSRYHKGLIEDGEDEFEIPHFLFDDIEGLILAEEKPLPPRYPENDECQAVIIYTSGTTGSPKGVVLTHRNIIADIWALPRRVEILPSDNFISVLPVHHVFEATCGFLTPLSIGCGICYARALRGKEILEDIQASDATIMLGVPLLFEKFFNGITRGVREKGVIASAVFNSAMGLSRLIDSAFGGHSGKTVMNGFRNKAGFAGLRLMISGGAAIRPDIVRFFNSFGVVCVQGYGLSETSPVITANPAEKNKAESVGPAIDGVELKILEPNSEGVGEVMAKGDPVFAQYYKNPEATREAFTEEGWFRTGDLGSIDPDGYLILKGREKNIIVTSGGKNVYPEEIEEIINQTSYVMESLIVGVVNRNSEEPFAILVPDFDALDEAGISTTEDNLEKLYKEVISEVNTQIATYKRVRNFKIQQEEFPKTSTRKIKRYLYSGKKIEV